MSIPTGLLISASLRLMPLYVLASLRSAGFRNGVRADERSHYFSQFKTLPLTQVRLSIKILYYASKLTYFSVITIDLSGLVPRRQYQFRGMFD